MLYVTGHNCLRPTHSNGNIDEAKQAASLSEQKYECQAAAHFLPSSPLKKKRRTNSLVAGKEMIVIYYDRNVLNVLGRTGDASEVVKPRPHCATCTLHEAAASVECTDKTRFRDREYQPTFTYLASLHKKTFSRAQSNRRMTYNQSSCTGTLSHARLLLAAPKMASTPRNAVSSDVESIQTSVLVKIKVLNELK